ncbi:hypothetical protein Leryth_017592 [Lithospermum erythrorhizon]|nr:hypothetical protein Leryth_017592 [Lithospermum erythrorhizon]
MLVSVFLALFLPCAGMSAVFVVYICLLWYAAGDHNSDLESGLQVKSSLEKGLSSSDLEKLPKVTGKELVINKECVVCLDDIEKDQLVRLVPCCNHGFHLECADSWLTKNSICPVCRAKLPPDLFNPPQPPFEKV